LTRLQRGRLVVRDELREDAIRDTGWRMARWVWRELDAPAALVRRLADRLGRT
jgi:hypothetical protein